MEVREKNNNLSLIHNVDINTVKNTMSKIVQFQGLVQQALKENHDYGIIPGTKRKNLLKPGAEKLLMLLGLSSEYEIINAVEDLENGFFNYSVRCILKKNGELITQGLGTCNTRETKYIKLDAYTLQNTILKMAKKRAQIDAALTVGSLSDIFTQDMEDLADALDIQGNKVQKETYGGSTFEEEKLITKAQAGRLYAICKGNKEIFEGIAHDFNYPAGVKTTDIKVKDYNEMCKAAEAATK